MTPLHTTRAVAVADVLHTRMTALHTTRAVAAPVTCVRVSAQPARASATAGTQPFEPNPRVA
jgi:hypothetical protein